jgi:CDP-4-dehydro-6-deoxyglucose reductase
MALQPWRKGIIKAIIPETPDTNRYFIEIPELELFDFLPGQFVTIDLPIHEKPNKRWRSYSISSHPNGSNIFELLIVLNPDGLGTPYIFREWKVGAEIILRGPQGVFTLQQPIEKALYLICTGTGIAPFRSMVNYIDSLNIPHQEIVLIYGCRRKDNLMYFDELTALSKNLNGFSYIPTLSRENWEGRTGYVHSVYEELCINRPNAQFYLCGWKEMIDEAKGRILNMGYDKKDIHLEIYG